MSHENPNLTPDNSDKKPEEYFKPHELQQINEFREKGIDQEKPADRQETEDYDVARHMAETQDPYMKDRLKIGSIKVKGVKVGPFTVLGPSQKSIDKGREKADVIKELYGQLQDLKIETSFNTRMPELIEGEINGRAPGLTEVEISCIINGHLVSLEAFVKSPGSVKPRKFFISDNAYINGFIDGKELNSEDSEKLFMKYEDVFARKIQEKLLEAEQSYDEEVSKLRNEYKAERPGLEDIK